MFELLTFFQLLKTVYVDFFATLIADYCRLRCAIIIAYRAQDIKHYFYDNLFLRQWAISFCGVAANLQFR